MYPARHLSQTVPVIKGKENIVNVDVHCGSYATPERCLTPLLLPPPPPWT